ncbi:AraC family transcriptional regulator [Colwellia sp. MSW7]|uniref:AraC family transcriptional regulator n=1 Tax=Colwellia maritima TaxID=2912588 RepID=A0ABS9X5U7_9GAMM|nr:AraC family transcriptional regulator [Colwellia maritima]MCI2285604.1 AraC family transcriptional regulator [Colwellia maritima]
MAHSTSVNNIKDVLKALAVLGINGEELLAEHNINLTDYKNDMHRVPGHIAEKSYSILITAANDPLLVFKAAKEINPASYSVLGFSSMCSENLSDFFSRFEKYHLIIGSLNEVAYKTELNINRLIFKPLIDFSSETHDWHHEFFCIAVLRVIRMIYHSNYSFEQVTLATSPKPEYRQYYEDYFGCPVIFECDETVLYINHSDCSKPLYNANSEVASQNDLVALKMIAKLNEGDFSSKLKALMIELLPTGYCRKEKAAEMLFISPRVLHRKLHKLGLSYQSLLDETRQELAEQYLKSGVNTLEIAFRLGYTDSSNFSRSFKRWFGISPSDYKNQNERSE